MDIEAIRKQTQIPRRTVSELCDEVERLRDIIDDLEEGAEVYEHDAAGLREENEELQERLDRALGGRFG